jgi:hypothetical protein
MGKRNDKSLLKKKPGRQPKNIVYCEVDYDSSSYGVGFVETDSGFIPFVFDKEDTDKIIERNWHVSANKYISSSVVADNVKKELLMHNLVLDRLEFNGKGPSESVDHISRNSFDNRKINLRIATASEQVLNHGKHKRRVELPPDSGICIDDIPRHIWYVKANGLHGDRFAIEFKTENVLWRSSSSKKMSLIQKLEEAKEKLLELYEQYPYLNPHDPAKLERHRYLINSFKEIVSKAAAPMAADGFEYIDVTADVK